MHGSDKLLDYIFVFMIKTIIIILEYGQYIKL